MERENNGGLRRRKLGRSDIGPNSAIIPWYVNSLAKASNAHTSTVWLNADSGLGRGTFRPSETTRVTRPRDSENSQLCSNWGVLVGIVCPFSQVSTVYSTT